MADSPELGWKARDFALGKTCTLAGVRGPKGTLVAFICNHCSYDRLHVGAGRDSRH